MAAELARRLFTVDEYYRMSEAGIFREDDRVELLEGEILEMPPIGSGHAGIVNHLVELLVRGLVQGTATVSVQNPVRLSDLSEPQPDICLLNPREDSYITAHPRPEDILLLIEVSDSTAAFDRQVKLPLYARAGIREVWIVDLTNGVVELHRQPSSGGYIWNRTAGRGESVSPEAFPALTLSTDGIVLRPSE